ncbi:hypothetical protein MKS88_003977 [Plasmodium brasilianum]|uniref:Uncharacterized protein n=1 Tax=Plasmodium brasilianum TaxID=5824 RepID=A0ACB9Y898_PLABR|nr:hypothetical protein MKS88_003977 [Plasmodium brasilianum]
MKQKILFLSIIKISEFILLPWTWHLDNDMSLFMKFIKKNYNLGKILDVKTNRILEKYKENKDSRTVCLNKYITNYESNEKKDISNNEKKVKEKTKQSNGNSVNPERHKQHMKNITYMFETKKYSRMERKIFKELDYIDFLQNNKAVVYKLFRKIVFKKYRARICLPLFLFLFLLVSILLDFSCNYGIIGWLLKVLQDTLGANWSKPLHFFLQNLKLDFLWRTSKVTIDSIEKDWTFITKPFLGYIIYFIPFLILGITTILGIAYYHKKVKKYQTIKFRKRQNI